VNRLTFFGVNLKALGAFAFLYPLIGHAQAAAVDPALAQGADLVFDKIARGEWWPAAGALVSLLTLFIHSPLAKRLPEKLQALLGQPLVNFFTPVVLSALGGLATMMASGHTDWKAYAGGVGKSAMAAGFAFLLAKNAAEQLAGGAPKPPPMVIALLVGAGLALAPLPARAQALTVGPSLPAFVVQPGAGHPVTLAAGAGVTVGADFFPTTLLEQKTHWLTVGLDGFGALVPVGAKVGGSASLGLHACLLGLFCVGGGVKLLDTLGAGALDGKLDHRSFFVLFEPDCRVMKLLWPALAPAPPPAEAEPHEACDGDHPCAGAGGGSAGDSKSD
jgi:hypothetical protein